MDIDELPSACPESPDSNMGFKQLDFDFYSNRSAWPPCSNSDVDIKHFNSCSDFARTNLGTGGASFADDPTPSAYLA